MRLEVATFQVRDVAFGKKTQIRNGTLVIDKAELLQHIGGSSYFNDVEIDIAKPGESVRIVHAMDVVEPRVKVEGPGGVFPGFLGPPITAGEGKTNRLAGVTVMSVGEPMPNRPSSWREAIVDMSGPASNFSPFGKTINVTLAFKPDADLFSTDGVAALDVTQGAQMVRSYVSVVTLAGLKAAEYLARATVSVSPTDIEVFELGPCDASLLKVACAIQAGRPYFYGDVLPLIAGTMIHPNESFDGALVLPSWGTAALRQVTYLEQNNEVFMELCRRHGREINFVGCVLFGGPTPAVHEKERISSMVSRTIRVLGAQAAVLVGQNGSNFAIDLMWTLQKCEKAGIKTTLIYTDVGTGSEDQGFIFSVPEADAIVSTGSREQPVTLPQVEKVIGGPSLLDSDVDSAGELSVPMHICLSANNVLAMNHLTTRFL